MILRVGEGCISHIWDIYLANMNSQSDGIFVIVMVIVGVVLIVAAGLRWSMGGLSGGQAAHDFNNMRTGDDMSHRTVRLICFLFGAIACCLFFILLGF